MLIPIFEGTLFFQQPLPTKKRTQAKERCARVRWAWLHQKQATPHLTYDEAARKKLLRRQIFLFSVLPVKLRLREVQSAPAGLKLFSDVCMSQYCSHLRRQARTSTGADSRASSEHDSCPCDRAYSKACRNTLLKPSCGTRFPRSLSRIKLCPNILMLRAATQKNPNPSTSS